MSVRASVMGRLANLERLFAPPDGIHGVAETLAWIRSGRIGPAPRLNVPLGLAETKRLRQRIAAARLNLSEGRIDVADVEP